LDVGAYQEALTLLSTLLTEVKKLDDKLLLVEIFMLESRGYHALKNLARSRVSFLWIPGMAIRER